MSVLLTTNAAAANEPDCSEPERQWSFQWENDSFPSASRNGSDRFYTNGIRISRSRQGEGIGFLNTVLDKLWFSSHAESSDLFCSRSGFRFGHQFYTPQTIVSTQLDVNDRPYAGFVYGAITLGKASRPEAGLNGSATVLRTAELQFGVVGPAAGARGIQSEWHRVTLIDAPTPLGWHNQIPNEPVVNVNLTAARRMQFGKYFDLVPQIDVGMGTVFTGGKVRATLRVGNYLKSFPYNRIHPKVQIKPMAAQNALSAGRPGPHPRFTWWLFAGVEGEIVLHDIFLDGTVFSDSHSVDKKTFRTILTTGLHLEYRKYEVDLMWVTHSKEFETQAIGIDRHEYLSINLGWKFGK